MSNNVEAAKCILALSERQEAITVQTVSAGAAIHEGAVRNFLIMWSAGHWLIKVRQGKAFVYTLTPQGKAGLQKLVDEHDPGRDKGFPFQK